MMPPGPESHRDHTRRVKRMFEDIAARYDCMNRLMTFGHDGRWRRFVVMAADPPPGSRLLDVGCGTGRIALAALRRHPSVTVVAADFAPAMMHQGRRALGKRQPLWCAADALRLPFADRSFDAVTSGYLLRNVLSPEQALTEQVRVLKPGGSLVCLDTSPPPAGPLRPLILFHLLVLIPWLGQVVAGDKPAYTYLPRTTQTFLEPEQLAAAMRRAGLHRVVYRRFMWNTQVVAAGRKPR